MIGTRSGRNSSRSFVFWKQQMHKSEKLSPRKSISCALLLKSCTTRAKPNASLFNGFRTLLRKHGGVTQNSFPKSGKLSMGIVEPLLELGTYRTSCSFQLINASGSVTVTECFWASYRQSGRTREP